MGPTVHDISSDSDDSLPDLSTRILEKNPSLHNGPVHTLSSDEDDKENDILVDPTPFVEKRKDSNAQTLSTLRWELEEDLPDIHNFSMSQAAEQGALRGGQDDPPKDPPRKKTKKEEQLEEKERRRIEREAERRRKDVEKAEMKARREAEKTSKRAMKPGECTKYVVVQLDRQLVEMAEGSHVLRQLQEAQLRYRVVDSAVPAAVTIVRVDPLTLQETLGEEGVVVVGAGAVVEAVHEGVYGGGAGLTQACTTWLHNLNTHKLTLLVTGLEAYFRGHKSSRNQEFRSAVLGGAGKPKKRKDSNTPNVTRVDVETALVTAQLELGVSHRLMSDPAKIATFLTQLAKAVAEAPFKWDKAESSFSWYAEGSSSNAVKVDKSGVGLLKLWHQQLRQFNNVGVELAQAIAREYSSPTALVKAYERCGSVREAGLLLADIPVRRGAGPLTSTRRIGPELSKKVHLLFTSSDPEVSLSQTG